MDRDVARPEAKTPCVDPEPIDPRCKQGLRNRDGETVSPSALPGLVALTYHFWGFIPAGFNSVESRRSQDFVAWLRKVH